MIGTLCVNLIVKKTLMQQISLQIGRLPLNIICLENGCIAISPNQSFTTLIDNHGGTFDSAGFTINGENYEYNTAYQYKTNENLLTWLVLQEMPMPVFQQQPQGFGMNVNDIMRNMQEAMRQRGEG